MIYVSISTIPQRLKNLNKSVESLLKQTQKPSNKIHDCFAHIIEELDELDIYYLPYDRRCMHEVVFSADWQKERGVSGLEVAKRLLDYGYHAPTMYFPLIVHEALMIEPTESETRETLDAFIGAMRSINQESHDNPELVQHAPHTTPVSRLDEAGAARRPDLRWRRDA